MAVPNTQSIDWKSILQTILGTSPCGLHIDEITSKIFDAKLANGLEREDIKKKANAFLFADSGKKNPSFVRVKDKRTGKFKKGIYKIAPVPKKAKNARTVQGVKAPEDINTTYTGTAGEYLIMSELLFQGYNVNKMTVDEGVDIVASKGNRFFFIQVKTAYLKEDLRVTFSIKRDRFELYKDENNMRYVFCVRYRSRHSDAKIECKYFSFTNSQLAELMYEGRIMEGKDVINVKIRFGEAYKPLLYNDDKEKDISFNMDKII